MLLPKCATALSTNTRILILSPDKKTYLGAVQSLNITKKRNVDINNNTFGPIRIKGKIVRARFNGNTLQEIFDKQIMHTNAQKQPFDIWVIDKIPFQNEDKVMRTELHNCWVTKLNTTYKADDFVIADEMDFIAEKVVTQEHLTEDEEIVKDIIL